MSGVNGFPRAVCVRVQTCWQPENRLRAVTSQSLGVLIEVPQDSKCIERWTEMIRSFFVNALVAMAMLGFLMPAHGQLVSTGDALALEDGSMETRVEAYLLRDDVAAELASYGVSHEMAMARVASMSAEELQQLSGNIDEMPAGAGIIYVLGVVFIVLIVMNYMGR